MSTRKINVGIIGASGYTGADAVRLLAGHPHSEIKLLTGNAHAGNEALAGLLAAQTFAARRDDMRPKPRVLSNMALALLSEKRSH